MPISRVFRATPVASASSLIKPFVAVPRQQPQPESASPARMRFRERSGSRSPSSAAPFAAHLRQDLGSVVDVADGLGQ